jgi:gamma-glutamyltranspeptidase/glutathione hydrolase
MLTRADGGLWAPFGVMGGFMQPQGHVHVVLALLDDGAPPQAAVDRPRFCIEPVDGAGKLMLEDGVPAATAAALGALGHDVVAGVSGFDRALFGRGQIIRRDPDGHLDSGSDLRADGGAAET